MRHRQSGPAGLRRFKRANVLALLGGAFVVFVLVPLYSQRDAVIDSQNRGLRTGSGAREVMRPIDKRPAIDPTQMHSHWVPWQSEEGKFTVYMITYDRDALCKRVVKHYAQSDKVDKIILSWNNLGRDPPPTSEFELSGKELIIVQETVDSLNNRFKPHPAITTDAIFAVDDDILIPLEIVEFAFSTFKQFPTTIIGFSQYVRMHQKKPTFQKCRDEEDNKWHYSSECESETSNREYIGPKPFPVASIALDSAVFFHKRYLDMYTHDLPPEVHQHVDKVRNCEDLALPMMIAHHTRLPPVTVDAPGMEHLQDLNPSGHHPGLNTMQGHYQIRTNCLNVFEKHFGYMPLQYSNFKLQPFPEHEVI